MSDILIEYLVKFGAYLAGSVGSSIAGYYAQKHLIEYRSSRGETLTGGDKIIIGTASIATGLLCSSAVGAATNQLLTLSNTNLEKMSPEIEMNCIAVLKDKDGNTITVYSDGKEDGEIFETDDRYAFLEYVDNKRKQNGESILI